MTPTNHPAPESEREAVARIIAPQLFEKYDAELKLGTIAANGQLWAEVCFRSMIDNALTRADAILSRGGPVAEPLRDGIKSAVTWLLSRAREMNDPNAKAVLNSAAFGLGQDLKYREHELTALAASPPAPALDARMVEALRPFAAISLVRDHDPDGSDMIDAPDLSITPNDVRRARAVLAIRADQGK
jgi:hypothetical protein